MKLHAFREDLYNYVLKEIQNGKSFWVTQPYFSAILERLLKEKHPFALKFAFFHESI